MKDKIRVLERGMEELAETKKALQRVIKEAPAAKIRLDHLNAGMNYLLLQPPHNGQYFDQVSPNVSI